MRRRWVLFAAALAACSGGPGRTPIEQAPLGRLYTALDLPLLISLEHPVQGLEEVGLVMQEFSRLPVELAVVWQCSQSPSTDWLAQVQGRRIRQYWDPERKTPSTGGRLRVNGKLVALQRVPLRVALAQYSARPN